MIRADEIGKVLTLQKGKREYLLKRIASAKSDLEIHRNGLGVLEKCQLIIQAVAELTQNDFKDRICVVATSALKAVFGDSAYSFEMEFISKRGKTEVVFFFVTPDGLRVDPISASGGGAVDVASFALRVAIWNLLRISGRENSDVVVLDEPFRFLSLDLQQNASDMVKMLSEKFGLQFIVITHNDTLTGNADKVFKVKKIDGISHVKERVVGDDS